MKKVWIIKKCSGLYVAGNENETILECLNFDRALKFEDKKSALEYIKNNSLLNGIYAPMYRE